MLLAVDFKASCPTKAGEGSNQLVDYWHKGAGVNDGSNDWLLERFEERHVAVLLGCV